jgi:ATP-dependent Clp protease ATP-binding subunit ClpX
MFKRALRCSFCRKTDAQVTRLLGGPGVYICEACVGACTAILKEHDRSPAPPVKENGPSP